PLMAMLRSHALAANTSPFRLLYSVRKPEAIFYRDELRALSNQGDSLSLTYAFTRSTPKDWPYPAGRVNGELILNRVWPATSRPSSYVCGPTSFVEHATDLLIAAGYDRNRIRTERFGATGGRQQML